MRSSRFLFLIWSVLALLYAAPDPAHAQAETAHTPQGAVWRSAVIPGWGQVYNGQIYKVPVVYVGLAGMAAGAIYYSREHRLWDRAFRYQRAEELIASGALDDNPCMACLDDYERLLEEKEVEAISSNQLRPIRDNLRRNRDLFVVGVGLWHGLAVLDAYVSAHLLDFDVGDDLTISVQPRAHGIAATMRLR